MGVHITRVYTRTGDDGTTGLSDFSRVSKNEARLVAYADCEEANAAIGVAVALGKPNEPITATLLQIQNDLFDAGADLATPVIDNPCAAGRFGTVGPAARCSDRGAPGRTLGMGGGRCPLNERKQTACQVPEPTFGPDVHPVQVDQHRRRRALAAGR